MNEFYENLTDDQKDIFDKYKSNTNSFCYILNNQLRSGDTKQQESEIALLDEITSIYQSQSTMSLHRATTESLVLPFIENDVYINPEFLSTSTDLESIEPHFTDSVSPVYLKIECPVGAFMAPMQGNPLFGDTEDEMLLGRNINFRVLENRVTQNKIEIENIMGKFYAQGVTALRIIEIERQ
jgi:hypothetical protein